MASAGGNANLKILKVFAGLLDSWPALSGGVREEAGYPKRRRLIS